MKALLGVWVVALCWVFLSPASAQDAKSVIQSHTTQTFRDCEDGCPQMIAVPPGHFVMGSDTADTERPAHAVSIRARFAVGRFEVTFREWEACVAGGGCGSNRKPDDAGWGRDDRPVINVSWNDAQEYVGWLSRKTGESYRLLSEAEWEYVARAGSAGNWWFGDGNRTGDNEWYSPNSKNRTQPVGRKLANAFGVNDILGNVAEWVEDVWHDSYQGAPTDGTAWILGSDGSRRVARGGSWVTGLPVNLRSASRMAVLSRVGTSFIGFRVARMLAQGK